MPKLNFSALRQEAAIADAARQSAAENRTRLIDNVYAYAYETSRDGILTLLRLAHLSMVSEDFPSEVPTQNEFSVDRPRACPANGEQRPLVGIPVKGL